MLRTYRTPKGTELPISVIRGKEYLEVKYRIQWFREEHPDWRIHTEIIHHDQEKSLVLAKILDAAGNIMATAHKQEDKRGFPDHLEKAETSAIGRALALCGFGTQFTATDLDEGERLADSPTGEKQPVKEPPWDEDGVGGEYVIKIGKLYKGLSIKEAIERDGLPKFQNWIHFLEDSAAKAGKPMSGDAVAVKINFERYRDEIQHQSSFQDEPWPDEVGR